MALKGLKWGQSYHPKELLVFILKPEAQTKHETWGIRIRWEVGLQWQENMSSNVCCICVHSGLKQLKCKIVAEHLSQLLYHGKHLLLVRVRCSHPWNAGESAVLTPMECW